MKFDWDLEKDASNQRKHGVSFEQASSVFENDDKALEIYDEYHSDYEDRFITIGPIKDSVVMVVWTERAHDTIRIISARWATAREIDMYHRHLEQWQ
ncbi:MAG: BrnT family toxin [Bradymonadia bacterium]